MSGSCNDEIKAETAKIKLTRCLEDLVQAEQDRDLSIAALESLVAVEICTSMV